MANSAEKYVYVPTIGYVDDDDYCFYLKASLTGNTKDNTREVLVVFQAYAQNSGGYYDHRSPSASIYIDDVQKSYNSVQEIYPQNTWLTMTQWRGYIEAGKDVKFTGKYYSLGVNAWMPDVGDDHCVWVNVTLSLEPLASTIDTTSISFNVEEPFSLETTKGNVNYTDILKINLKVNDTTSIPIKTVHNYQSGNDIFFTSTELSEIYSYYGLNDDAEFTFQITTMDGGTAIGNSAIKTGTGTIIGNAHIKVSGNWKRGIAWINVDGVWKRGVLSTKVSDIWKRGV